MHNSKIIFISYIVLIFNFCVQSKNLNDNVQKRIAKENYEFGKNVKRFKIHLPIQNFSKMNDNRKIKTNPEVTKIEEAPLVNTSEGVIKGMVVKANDINYYMFQNIPYAEPPERFQAPKPPKPWQGIRDGTKETTLCYQKELQFKTIGGSEDCLYLIVNTPTLLPKNLSVIVWIYGGMFKYGTASSNVYNPVNFIKKDIVVVSVYYRVGAFGFLSTNTKHAPGNAGLKDIVMALRWIRRNIQGFGGNPSNICLYGASSGSVAIEALDISPLAGDLFDKAIIHSGSVLKIPMYIDNPVDKAYELGKNLGFVGGSIEDLMQVLLEANASSIVVAEEIMDVSNFFELNFAPSIESYVTEDRILYKYPEEMLLSREYSKRPIMIGFNNKDGTHPFRDIKNEKEFNEKFNEYTFENILKSVFGSEKLKKFDILKKVDEYYFKNKNGNIFDYNEVVDFMTDVLFFHGIRKSLSIRSSRIESPLYCLQFAFVNKVTKVFLEDWNKVDGAGHVENLAYTFRLPNKELKTNKAKRISKILVELLANFSKYGNPTPNRTKLLPIDWPSVTDDRVLPCLTVSDKLEIIRNPFEGRFQFWENLYSL